MKKLTVLFAMLFAAGTMMAQSNLSLVDQIGSTNVATVDQQGTDNYSDLDQVNDGNYYNLSQTGADNSSKLKQGATVGSYKDNAAEIVQLGDRNTLRNYSNGNAAVQGRENYLELYQKGDDNIAGVYQDSYDQDAFIYQYGDLNTAKVKQDAHLSYAKIWQKGYDNTSDIKQDGGAGTHYAKHEVLGDHNSMVATQWGFDNDLIVDQTWTDMANNSNIFTSYQSNHSSGLGNRAYLRMTGSDNEVHFSQSGSWNQIGGKDMYGDLDPTNVTTADMLNYKGEGSTIDITQSGNQNLVKSDMNNSFGDIDILQTGNVNITELFINDGSMGHHNDASISQTSTYNTSINNVMGDYNTISVTQN